MLTTNNYYPQQWYISKCSIFYKDYPSILDFLDTTFKISNLNFRISIDTELFFIISPIVLLYKKGIFDLKTAQSIYKQCRNYIDKDSSLEFWRSIHRKIFTRYKITLGFCIVAYIIEEQYAKSFLDLFKQEYIVKRNIDIINKVIKDNIMPKNLYTKDIKNFIEEL